MTHRHARTKQTPHSPEYKYNTNTNTKYTCDTGKTSNKLLVQWVHLTNHAAAPDGSHNNADHARVGSICKPYHLAAGHVVTPARGSHSLG